MLEIKQQLSGLGPTEPSNNQLEYSTDIPVPQQQLIKSLLTLPRPTIKKEITQRTKAIDSVATYYQF